MFTCRFRSMWRFVPSTFSPFISQLVVGRKSLFSWWVAVPLAVPSVVLQWRWFFILGEKFGNESKIIPISYNFIRIVVFPSLKNTYNFKKVIRHKIGRRTLLFMHILKFHNPPLKIACDILERHLHLQKASATKLLCYIKLRHLI